MKIFNLGRKLLAAVLLAVMTITLPAVSAMAAEAPVNAVDTAEETALPADLQESYLELTSGTIMPRSTTYFLPDQDFSFSGTYSAAPFNVPSACEARLVIAAIGSEPLYIDVMNGRAECERTITVTPNEAQVHVFNISSGTHYLRYRSVSGSIFTVRLQMYTWDY